MPWEKIKGTFANRRHIYCVTAQKLILNVSKIRLRLIFARALYLHRLFAKALDMQNHHVRRDNKVNF